MTPAMHVLGAMPQDLTIRASGTDVALLRLRDEIGDDASPDVLPDPVELFVHAVNQQMFPPAKGPECRSSARVTQRSRAGDGTDAAWTVRLDGAHPACLRVLCNLLAARDFDMVSVSGAARTPDAPTLDVARLPYPPAWAMLAFAVEREEGNRAASDRLLRVEFAQAPSDELVDSVSASISLWCDLLLLGAYPLPGMTPREAGVLPEGPILYDEYTVQIAFPEAFHADDRAFDAIVNHLHCLTQLGTAIAKVTIR